MSFYSLSRAGLPVSLLLFALIGLLTITPSAAQKQKKELTFTPADIDSLEASLDGQKDTVRISTLLNLAMAYHGKDPMKSVTFSKTVLAEARVIKYGFGLGSAYNNLVTYYVNKFSFDTARLFVDSTFMVAEKFGNPTFRLLGHMNKGVLFYYQQQLDSAKASFENAVAVSEKEEILPAKRIMLYNNIASVNMAQGNYQQSLDWFQKAAKASEILGNKESLAMSKGNIGTVYYQMADLKNAQQYFEEAYTLSSYIKNIPMLSALTLNLGVIYKDTGEPEKAMERFAEARTLKESIRDLTGLGIILVNEGEIHVSRNDLKQAEKCYAEAEKIALETKNQQILLTVYANQGDLLGLAGKHRQAGQKYEAAIAVAKASNLTPDLMKVYKAYSEAGEKAGDFKTAFIYHKLFKEIEDSIFSAEKSKTLAELGTQYESEKKEREIELLTRDKVLSNVMIEKQEKEKWVLWGLASAFLCIGGLIFRNYRVKLKDNKLLLSKNETIAMQKTLVEQQKLLVEEKNNEVMASISYAKRLQDAILPPAKMVKSLLPGSFILYKPKDIVAGDFYWLEKAGDTILFAAADCTGHGVPGAMVSVVCSNALNRTVKEMGITEPGKILDRVRELVIDTFDKSEAEVKDGMDISLCAYNPSTGKLSWAGANNPLWIIRADTDEIFEIKGDKQPVGVSMNPAPFTSHELTLHSNDQLFIFTDGYADQFGGDRGKKFKSSAFRQLLLSMKTQAPETQKQLIDEAFETWRGDLEQVDDVCVIGLKA